MKGTLHETQEGWVVRFNKKTKTEMLGYHDYKIKPVYDELPVQYNDIDDNLFDIRENKEVNFEIRTVIIDDLASLHSEDMKYAKLINIEKNKLSRVEVIDENGRSYVKYFEGECELSYQDDGRTLKIFITPTKK